MRNSFGVLLLYIDKKRELHNGGYSLRAGESGDFFCLSVAFPGVDIDINRQKHWS